MVSKREEAKKGGVGRKQAAQPQFESRRYDEDTPITKTTE